MDRSRKTIKQASSTVKGTVKTTRKSIKTAEKTAKASIKTSQQAAKAAQRTAQATARTAVAAAKAAVKATVAAVKAIIAATKALIAAIAAGGWIVVLIIVVICLIGMLIGSCFGIFFSGEDSGTGQTMQTAVQEINTDYQENLDEIKASHSYDVKQEDLAKLVGVRRETIGNLEKGRYNPSLVLAWNIAKVYNVSIEEIFTVEN